MTMMVEASPELRVPSVEERVRALASPNLTPDQQWEGIRIIDLIPGMHKDDPGRSGQAPDAPKDVATALIDFARDPDSSKSTLVRAYALEKGILEMRKAISADPRVRTDVRADIGELYRELEDGLRDLFDPALRQELQGGHHRDIAPARREQIDAYRNAAIQLAEAEELSLVGTVIPWWDMSIEDGGVTQSYDIPLLPFLLAEYHAGNYSTTDRHDSPLVNYMKPELLQDSLHAVLNRGATSELLEDQGVLEFSKLTRYVREGGLEHAVPLDALYKLEPAQRREYVAALNGLYEAAQLLPEMVPEGLGKGAELGVRKLFANAMFAVMEHVKNDGHTEDTIPLVSGREVPVVLEGDEMLGALRDLEQGIRGAHEDLTQPDARSMLAVDAPDFRIWRIFRLGRGEPPRTKVILRPFGNRRYDPQHEFGHPTYGVEASIQIEHSLGRRTEGLPLSRKRDRRDNIIVIHFDREGHKPEEGHVLYRDPTQVEGTVSLDVDSLYGTSKAGLVLALGNKLRSEAINVECTKNHVTDDLDQYYGQSGPFAKEVLTFDGRLQGKQATRSERRTYQRQLVAASQPKQFLAAQVAV